jgi:hypothetical protein
MNADEGLALFTKLDLPDRKYAYLFLRAPPSVQPELGASSTPINPISPAAGISLAMILRPATADPAAQAAPTNSSALRMLNAPSLRG